MDRQLDGMFDKVQKTYGLEAFDKDILLLFSGHLHFPVCLPLRGVTHPLASRSAITAVGTWWPAGVGSISLCPRVEVLF